MSALTSQIESYKKDSKKLKRSEHIARLKGIGSTLIDLVPSQVTDQALKDLEYALGNLKKTLNNEDSIKENQISALNALIAKVSYLGQKKPSNRTEKMNLDILNLGRQILNLAKILSYTILPLILQNILDQFLLN